MGRPIAQIPKGSFSLRARPNSKGEQPVYLKYYFRDNYVKRSTEVWVLPKDWDNTRQMVKNTNKSAARINAKLASMKKQVDDQLIGYSGTLSKDIIQEMLDGLFVADESKADTTTFVDYCNQINETAYGRDDYGYSVYYNAKLYIKQFQAFLEKKEKGVLKLSQINKELIDEYVAYKLNEKNYKTHEGVNKSITPLIKAVKSAKDNGLIQASVAQPIIDNAYLEIKNRVYDPDLDDKGGVRYLNDEQLKAFIEYKPTSSRAKATEDIKDVFLFSMYACGLRVSDIVTLEWANIDFATKKLDKVQVKTKQRGKISPVLPDQAIEILERWKQRQLNDRFVFNYLPKDFKFGRENSQTLKMKINSADKTINTSLNTIGTKLNFPFSLTIHVARHTFCVRALSSGVSLHVVSQLMGHMSILATEKTYAHYLEEAVNTEMEKIISIFK